MGMEGNETTDKLAKKVHESIHTTNHSTSTPLENTLHQGKQRRQWGGGTGKDCQPVETKERSCAAFRLANGHNCLAVHLASLKIYSC